MEGLEAATQSGRAETGNSGAVEGGFGAWQRMPS